MSKSPFTTAYLKGLPRTSYAYRNAQGVWSVRHDGLTYAGATREANANTDAVVAQAWENLVGASRSGNAERDYEGI
jgi:hypothetical protein